MAVVEFEDAGDQPCRWMCLRLEGDDLDEVLAEAGVRVRDEPIADRLHERLNDLATTGLESEWIQAFLEAGQEPPVAPWEVGEALAEVILQRDHAARFPWNTRRDARVPKASLPGADLVGFLDADGVVALLFGEVKSSSDADTPPNVLYGRSGMVSQLETLISSEAVQLKLLKWLEARTIDPAISQAFEAGLQRYVESLGREKHLFGVLVRDTAPSADDVRARAQSLGTAVEPPTRATLLAVYLPYSMATWPARVAV